MSVQVTGHHIAIWAWTLTDSKYTKEQKAEAYTRLIKFSEQYDNLMNVIIEKDIKIP